MILNCNLQEEELVSLLKLDNFDEVYYQADEIRKKEVGDYIQVRALLEFSNHCRRQCRYCGLNCKNNHIVRYRMSVMEIVEVAGQAAKAGYRTIVLQSGEDSYYTTEILGEIVREIKKFGMAITLSCGEMSYEDYAYLKKCGVDRYLLKHETADPKIYKSLHPCGTLKSRVQCLKNLKKLGYETGSGFMVGLPGQTLSTIAKDLMLLKEIPCDMAGIGPFIAHPDTELRLLPNGSTELTKRAVALARILLPKSNLPATTSLGVLDSQEKNHIFSCGANVIMKKVTPDPYKKLYEIYPATLGKTDIFQDRKELEQVIRNMGKIPI